MTSKGQVTVPIEVRRALDLHAGDALVFELHGDEIRVRTEKRSGVSELRLLNSPLVVAETLIALLRAGGVQAEEGRLVVAALESMARSNVDFVDAYLAEVARSKGEAVCSFDRDFARLDVEWMVPG
jgi:AbrB family looped-hinge helix DNA binding protein